MPTLDEADKALLFLSARTYRAFQSTPVPDALLREIYELSRMGPTAVNAVPLRIAYVRTKEAKAQLLPALDAGNVPKAQSAPVTAILAFDSEYFAYLDRLNPHAKALSARTAERPEDARIRAAQSGATLQAGYFILAARGLGLDCGPMEGFDKLKVDAAFFSKTPWRSFMLVNLGYGDAAALHPRAPRLEVDEACSFL